MLFCPKTAFNNVIGKIRFLLKEVGINLTFSVSGYRSKRPVEYQHNLLGVLQTMTRLPTPLSAVTIIKIDWIMRVKAF